MSRKYTASQYLTISGFECGTEIEVKMVVAFKVKPGRDATMIDPAEEPTVDIDDISFIDGTTPCDFPEWIVTKMAEGDGFSSWLLGEASEQEEISADEAADMRRDDRDEQYIRFGLREEDLP